MIFAKEIDCPSSLGNVNMSESSFSSISGSHFGSESPRPINNKGQKIMIADDESIIEHSQMINKQEYKQNNKEKDGGRYYTKYRNPY